MIQTSKEYFCVDDERRVTVNRLRVAVTKPKEFQVHIGGTEAFAYLDDNEARCLRDWLTLRLEGERTGT
jgi:hypothetical protein